MPGSTRRQHALWKLTSTLGGVAGAMATRKLLEVAWPAGDEGTGPPFNPADRRVAWPTALRWALAAGVGASVARLLTERVAAAGWEAATGAAPPGIET